MPYKDPEKARANGRENHRRYTAKLTAAKVSAFEASIATRPVWPELDLAWAAGMFEGEGTITIVRSGRYSRSVVCLTNTDRQIVDFFQDRWPGLIAEKPARGNWSIAWTWRLQGNHIFSFLLDVAPYFRTAQEQAKAELLMKSQRARWAGYRLEGHMTEIDRFVEQIRHLNLRGAARAAAAGV